MAATTTPMHLYALGSNTWFNTSDFPLTRDYTRYYLQADGELSPAAPTGNKGSDAIQYTQPGFQGGTVSYTSQPLAEGTTIAGPISATLYASSSGTNLNLIAELDQVSPNGTVTKITSGSLVGSLRKLDVSRSWYDAGGADIRPYGSFGTDAYLTPTVPVKLEFALEPTVYRVPPGDSLALTITTQTPFSACEGILGTNPCYPTAPQLRTLPGTYQVWHGPELPSALNLPLLPYTCFLASGGSGSEPDSFTGLARTTATPCPA